MRLLPRSRLAAWITILASLSWVLWADIQRGRHVARVSQVDASSAVIDPQSASGYANGKRWLIVPEHHFRTYQWIAETQHMLAQHDLRVRHTNSENAPIGREVHATSLYRWWLSAIAWLDHVVTGRSLGLAVEHAAYWADPALHLAFMILTAALTGRWFGSRSAALVTLGLACFFPVSTAWLPGVLDTYGLAQALALLSVLPLIAGSSANGTKAIAPHASRGSFAFAGLSAGLGLWNNTATQVPLLLGIAIGGGFMSVLTRRDTRSGTQTLRLPWRTWSIAGATTVLVAYVLEYAPDHFGSQLAVIHPLYGVAWLGIGELLEISQLRGSTDAKEPRWRVIARLTLSIAMVTALPIALVATQQAALLLRDPLSSRLTFLTNGAVAKNFAAWIVRDGFSPSLIATVLPIILGLALILFAWRRIADAQQRRTLVFLGVPLVVLTAAACSQLRWWSTVEVHLIAWVAVFASTRATFSSGVRRVVYTTFGLAVAAGLYAQRPLHTETDAFTTSEVEGLIERGLAHFLADHARAEEVVFLAPPDRTASLTFYGNLRGLGTPNWENREGVSAAARSVSATTSDEAQALLAERGVTHLILPSWDRELDEFVRWTIAKPENSLLAALHKWALPPWLRPIPYPIPNVGGFEGQSVMVLAVTENTDRALSLAWLAEAAIELQNHDLALAASEALKAYPANLSALSARALVAKSTDNESEFEALARTLESNVNAGLSRRLPWERRLSLAVVLAQAARTELAKAEVQRCLREIDEAKLRGLSTGALLRLHALSRAFGEKIGDDQLQALARELLPPDLRR